jgi:16S rRNA (cytidine1402-2'-O)-methyltransferase
VSLDTTATSLVLQQAAAQVAGAQHLPPGTLYVVATPIGNLADLTLRAVHVLGQVDAVACEDTRLSGTLLQRLGLHRPLLALHEHNEEAAAAQVVLRLQRGERIAYISDAGTPAVSDPGARLVAAVQAAGLRAVPVPGASSVVTALSVAGDARAAGFRFEGFLPPQAAARLARLAELADERASVVLFEAPHRIEALAAALAEALPGRRLTVCRELTKQFEQVQPLDCDALPGWLAADADHRRGEFVLVLHGRSAAQADEATGDAATVGARRLLHTLLAELPLKQAVALTAQATGLARNALYEQALAWRDAQAGGSGEPGDPVPAAPTAAARPADWPADPRRVAAAAKPARRRGR